VFTDFLFALRRHGIPVGTQEWLAFHEALREGLIADSESLYGLGRAILVHREGHYDAYDLCFLEVFEDVEVAALSDALKSWLENPIPISDLSPEAFERMTGMSLDELHARFEELLRTQKERHDGGNTWIGTGGTSPFGHSGRSRGGIRVGGPGGRRSAMQVAGERRYRNYRTDVTIDVRQFKVALRALRHLGKEGPEQLDLDHTIDATSKAGGEIELCFERERRNTVRLALMMDAGGSMDPYARLVDRLFSAASELGHWRSFDPYFFHNCVYSRLYTNIERLSSVQTEELFRKHPPDTKFVFVGDACMAPWELTAAGGALSLWDRNQTSGLEWLKRFRRTFGDCIWLNPEPQRYWRHETIAAIARVIPMFPLSLDGLKEAMRHLRQGANASQMVSKIG
jgi:uncharacterized protein with von Willebrand factor type A (vWA) domain